MFLIFLYSLVFMYMLSKYVLRLNILNGKTAPGESLSHKLFMWVVIWFYRCRHGVQLFSKLSNPYFFQVVGGISLPYYRQHQFKCHFSCALNNRAFFVSVKYFLSIQEVNMKYDMKNNNVYIKINAYYYIYSCKKFWLIDFKGATTLFLHIQSGQLQEKWWCTMLTTYMHPIVIHKLPRFVDTLISVLYEHTWRLI